MAKKEEAKAVATQEPAGLPAYIKRGDTRGTEHLTREDVQIPRLKLAQGQSPQMLKSEPAYIEGLRLGEAFNDLTGEIYGDEPLEVVFVRADPPRNVLFDKDNRKTILEWNLKPTDPRCQFTTDEDGKRQPPLATKFYDFVLLLGPERTPMALSYSSTGIKLAQRLNGLIGLVDPKIGGPVAIFAKRYTLTPTEMKNAKGVWYLFSPKQAGLVDEETYKLAEQMFEAFKDKAVEFDRGQDIQEPGTDEM